MTVCVVRNYDTFSALSYCHFCLGMQQLIEKISKKDNIALHKLFSGAKRDLFISCLFLPPATAIQTLPSPTAPPFQFPYSSSPT